MRGIVFYVPEELATTPAEGHAFVNRWWTVHPEKGLAFYCERRRSWDLEAGETDAPSPQCNNDEATARHLQEKIYPGCITKQIAVVYEAHAIREMHRQRKLALETSQAVK